MRVGFLAHAARAGDAIGRQIASKVAFFRDRGADVRVVVATDRELHPALRPFAVRFLPQESEPIVAWLQSANLVLIEYSQHTPVLELIPLVAGGNARLIFDYHGVTPPALGGASHRDLLVRGAESRRLAWFADFAIVHSQFARNELREATHFPSNRTRTLGYPIDTAWLSPGAPVVPLRQRLGIDPQSRLLLFVGRLAPNKRATVLVESLAHLPDDMHAVFAGDCGDCYETERQHCRERAARHRVAQRVHFLGPVDEETLRDAYRDADVFVMPSVHEGFCLPVIEAMACGLPVVAARAAALPETLGDAGLTFTPDDSADLAKRVLQVLTSRGVLRNVGCRRVAIVAGRFGDGFVGGAEASLRLLATRMNLAGHAVEVFTIGRQEDTTRVDGLPVHRFRADFVDAQRRSAAAHAISLANGLVNADTEAAFIENTVRSARLVEALRERGPFDAIVAGPYPTRLTVDVANAFTRNVVLVPCWHDEPAARLPTFGQSFADLGGVLFHSPEEQRLAQSELGMNHPNSGVIGTVIDALNTGNADAGRAIVGTDRRYLVFAGRYCREKGLDRLIGFVRRYAAHHPDRFSLAFMGGGDEQIPDESWARDLGYVTDDVRRDVLAGADALILLSTNESLSFAVLEAQASGIPVIVEAGNAVLEGHLQRGAGGVSVSDYESFAAALDDLWSDQDHWRRLGQTGRAYATRHYTDAAAFDQAWQAVVNNLHEPLGDQLRTKGRNRAESFSIGAWREQFGKLIDAVLVQQPRQGVFGLDLYPRTAGVCADAGCTETVVPLRLTARGDFPILADGPSRYEIVSQVMDANGNEMGQPLVTALPGILVPDESVAAIARLRVPPEPGNYAVAISVTGAGAGANQIVQSVDVPMIVCAASLVESDGWLMQSRLRSSFAAAQGAHHLPDSFVDVSLGAFARIKRWLKRKLLHNFQAAYVDVLSRQQSAFNRHVLTVLAEMSEAQAALAHALQSQSITAQLKSLRRRQRRLARKLDRIQAALTAADQESPA